MFPLIKLFIFYLKPNFLSVIKRLLILIIYAITIFKEIIGSVYWYLTIAIRNIDQLRKFIRYNNMTTILYLLVFYTFVYICAAPNIGLRPWDFSYFSLLNVYYKFISLHECVSFFRDLQFKYLLIIIFAELLRIYSFVQDKLIRE